MIYVGNTDDMAGVSLGEQLVHAMIRLSILGDRSFNSAEAVVDHYLCICTDYKERDMLVSLKKVMKMAKEICE